MIRIFVTGDNHIGLRYASHEQGAILAASRIQAFEEMVSAANSEECELFVITGDLFENTYSISKRDIKVLLDMLSCFKGMVAVLPGNHDYYDKDVKVWQYFRDLLPSYDNIMLLSDYRPYKVTAGGSEVILYPALCTSVHSAPGENNLDWIKSSDIDADEAFHIGIAHGAVEGETIDNEGRYFLMKRSELEEIPVDIWLIGHTHVPFPRSLTEEYSACGKIFNAGTHVQTDVACNTEGQCFIVEIADDKAVRAKKFVSGNLHFCRKNISLSAGRMEEILDCELGEVDDRSVVDIILSGAVTAEEYESRASVLGAKLARFIEGTYNDYALTRLISEELIRSEFPETSFSASLLTALLDEPKEAQLAYELLRALKEGR
ncbi:MAG: metallophosphoesterase [Oscillospiraceae bacterium]|nr:metallophosphoesterase [Oscillospiraceae bacterium]